MTMTRYTYYQIIIKAIPHIFLCAAVLIALTGVSRAHGDTGKAFDALLKQGGHNGPLVILLRHALAPGTGDPDNFDVRDCGTQRNLSKQGRIQAQRIGQRLKAHDIQGVEVFSSQWCRCLETGRLLDFGVVTELPVINSFYRRDQLKSQYTQDLKAWLMANRSRDTSVTILVTHQVNITALTQVFPSSGEMVVVDVNASGEVTVLSRLAVR